MATNGLTPWLKPAWCLPPVSAECVWRRKAVVDLSAAPSDPPSPVVCVAALPSQLRSEGRPPVLAAPGPPVRSDDAYRREGTCHVCMSVPPRGGGRHVKGTDRRTAQDFAHGMQDLVDSPVPQPPCRKPLRRRKPAACCRYWSFA